MKVRKLLAAALATTMIIGSSMVVLADDPAPASTGTKDIVVDTKGTYTTTTTTVSEFQEPVVKVVVPTSTPVYLNPYRIKTSIEKPTGDTSMKEAVTDSQAQIVAATYIIRNESNLDVKIVPTITTTAKGAVMIDQSKTTDTSSLTTKWVKLNAKVVAGTTGALIAGTGFNYDMGHKYTGKDTDVAPTFTLKAATFSGTGDTYAMASNGAVTAELSFVGTLNTPDKVATTWSEQTDSLTIVIKYDIYPQALTVAGD